MMFTYLGSTKEIAEVYRMIFIFLSGSAFIFLLYISIKNKRKGRYAIPALIYFAILFGFYVMRLFNLPSDVYIANMLSNTIHLLACILIFSIALMLVSEKK